MPRFTKQQRYENNFMMVANAVFKDETLSLSAKGLFGYFWSMPEDWKFYIDEIVGHSTTGKSTTKKAIKELEEHGYLIRVMTRDERGHYKGMRWFLNDKPELVDRLKSTFSPSGRNTADGETVGRKNRQTVNDRLLIINNTNNKKTNNKNIYSSTATGVEPQSQIDQIKQEFESIWQKYPVKQNKKKAFSSYKAWRKESKDHTSAYLAQKLAEYLKYCKLNQEWYRPMNGGTWFSGRFEDELDMTPPKPRQTYQRQPQYVEHGTDWQTVQPVEDVSPKKQLSKDSSELTPNEINAIFARFSAKGQNGEQA